MKVLTIVKPEGSDVNSVIECFETALQRARLSPEEAEVLNDSLETCLESLFTEAYSKGLKDGHTAGYQQAREDYEV